MKKLFSIILFILLAHGISWGIPPIPPVSIPTTCSNGQVAVWNSTTLQWDTCADLAGGGDMLASVYVTTGKVKAATGGTGIDSSGLTGVPLITAGVWSAITPGSQNSIFRMGASAPAWTSWTMVAPGSAGKIFRDDGTNWAASTFTIPATPTANKVYIGDGTNIILSTPTVPLASSPTAGKVMIGDGTNWVASTPTYPNASPSAGKILIGDGTNFIASTPTYPNSAPSAGKILIGDGINFIASTPTYPNASPAAGKILIGDGTNFIASTPTYPNASATARKILVSDGTNFVASTETWAVPGATVGYVLTSNGTNWTSAVLPSNSSTAAGIVASGAAQVNLVWKTDADGVPGWRDDATGGTPTFDTVATGTNVTATMTVGAGATLTYSTTGIINASKLVNVTPVANALTLIGHDFSGMRTDLGLVIGTNVQAYDADLTTYAGITPSANIQSLLGAADYAAMRTQLGLVIGTNIQAYDADLTTYAGITPSANIQSLLGAADYAAMRTQFGLVIGTNVQAYDADLDYLATFTPSANVKTILNAADYAAIRSALGLVISTNVQAYDADLTTYAGITPSANIQSLLGAADYAAMRTQLGLVIGTNVQAYDADLTTYAGITPSANVQSLLGAADYSAMRTLLSLVPGTNVQTYDATLAALAALTITQGSMIQGTGTDAFSVLAKGTTRQILQMNTGATAFEWTSSMDGIIIGASTPAAGTFTALTANSVTLSKTSGIAGDVGLYEANSTDTDAAGFTGPLSLTSNTSYRGRFPNARVTSANTVLAWTNAAETGTGTPADPYIQAMSFVDLDNYALLSGTTFTGLITTLASASGGAGVNFPHGAAPSSPVNGDIWTTTAGVYARINGGTVGPFGVASGDVVGGSASGSGEIAAYGDTGGKLIGRSYVSFTGPATSVKAKTISNAADTIAELGQTNNFSAAQTISKVNAAAGSVDVLTMSGTLGIMSGSNTFRGIYLNYTNANHTGTSNVVALIDIPAITGDANANFYGIRVGNFTGTTGAAGEVERFLSIGTGFDHGIYSGSPVYIGDGTNGLTVSATGAVTLAGTAILPAITSTTVSATTSAQLAGVISDETGSGALVFGTGPSIMPQVLDASADVSPTVVQLSNTRVENYGQTTANVNITGPTLASGLNFIMIVGTAQASNYWRYTSTTANVYLDAGSAVTYIGFAAPAVGNAISCFSFRTGASTYSLKCTTLAGTSTSG